MADIVWLFKVLTDECLMEIEKRLRPHSVFTAPEAIDCVSLWIREYQACRGGSTSTAASAACSTSSTASRLQQVTEIIRAHKHTSDFIKAFKNFESTTHLETPEQLVWTLECIVKRDKSKWTNALAWLILMCIIHEDMPESKSFDIWRKKHTDGW